MGRHAYLTRLALGRSAFEPLAQNPAQDNATQIPATVTEANKTPPFPSNVFEYEQSYDSRGYAENLGSKELNRQSRRAQNDVLATVGVCVKEKSLAKSTQATSEKSEIQRIMAENVDGLLLTTADSILLCSATAWAAGLKQRLQTFRFYSGMPLMGIMRSEKRTFGIPKFLFAGGIASLVFFVVETTKVDCVRILYTLYAQEKLNTNLFLTRSWDVRPMILALKLATFVLLAPLEVYGTLQRLDLIPAWPVLPYPRRYLSGVQHFLRFPDLPRTMAPKTWMNFIASVALSPLFLWGMIAYTRPMVRPKVYDYVWAALPKPTNPDKLSLQGALEDELDDVAIPGLVDEDNSTDPCRALTSVTDIFARDLQSIGRNFQIFYDSCARLFQSKRLETAEEANTRIREALGIPQIVRESGQPERHTADSPHPLGNRDATPLEYPGFSVPYQLSPPHSPPPSPPPLIGLEEIPAPAPRSHSPITNSAFSTPHSPRSTPANSSRSPSPPIHITATTARDGGPRLNVTVPPPATLDPTSHAHGIPSTSTPSPASTMSNDRVIERLNQIAGHRPHHHVTALTAHAAESMAQHLSTSITDILYLPLEALFVRAVAGAFLESPAAGARGVAEGWRGEVFGMGAWFGGRGRGWRGVGDYVGKMVLVEGLKVAVGLVVWEGSSLVGWWIGRRKFGWGGF